MLSDPITKPGDYQNKRQQCLELVEWRNATIGAEVQKRKGLGTVIGKLQCCSDSRREL